MNALALIFTLVVAALLQALLPTMRWTGYTPAPVMLGLVMYYALVRPRSTMLQAAVGGGLLEDSLGQMPLGYSVFCYCVVALVVEHVRENVLVRQWTTHVAFGALANLGVTLATMLLLAQDGRIAPTFLPAALRLLGALVLGGLLTPLVFHALDGLERMLGLVDAEEHLA